MTAATEAFPPRRLGRTGLWVPEICFGGGALASMPAAFGYDVPEERALETVRAVLRGPVGFLDTAAGYGDGRSERIIGAALAEIGGPPPGFVLSTKVDRDPVTGDYSAAQVRRSLEGSLERLGLDRVQLLYLHDPEHISFQDGMAPGGPVEELVRIHEEGLAQHIGVAGGPVGLMARYVATGVFDVLLTHNRWTLIDRSADQLITAAHAAGLAVVNAAPFGGGVLAKGPDRHARYAYTQADAVVLDRVREIAAACAEHGVPLPAAAIQFSTRDPRISATVLGVTRPERVAETIELSRWSIPEELWPTLDALAAPSDHWQH
ncbi:aldo/keto reductase [Streptomyces sp. 3MP-14]|uniref:Aldo/keto reductase n=1 Tax=Streptomyces mimosae TaxID=2586635 RepID=A0A5N6A676_9ACTN|nr:MULTISPECIES: aldo/keto reductase [Streptomyces]KAB8164304.1 aldo/keto reductase [Streptomyces mimosae]KAB8176581.1 aldo/keto reductase [Streptomyces sp. 3MP-14]